MYASRRDDERHDDKHLFEERERKRRRREEKKERKEERRRRREAHELDGSGLYDDDAGDSNAPRRAKDEDVFVWKKKNDALRKQGVKVSYEDERRRRQELQEELERAKVRRAQREAERAEWEAEQARVAREREQEQNADWHRQEESFHGTQHFLRQAIRLRENRPSLVDNIAIHVRLDLLDIPLVSSAPFEQLDAQLEEQEVQVADIEKLIEDVETELDYIPDFPPDHETDIFTSELRFRWWTLVERYLKTLVHVLREKASVANASGVHSSVQTDIDSLLDGKSVQKLEEMEKEIAQRVEHDTNGKRLPADGYEEVDFWSSVLYRIRNTLSRARVEDLAQTLAAERERLMDALPQSERPTGDSRDHDHPANGARSLNDDQMLRAEEAKGMRPDEETFSEEVQVAQPRKRPYVPGHMWNDKYRPRKPRYFNRVHTGMLKVAFANIVRLTCMLFVACRLNTAKYVLWSN